MTSKDVIIYVEYGEVTPSSEGVKFIIYNNDTNTTKTISAKINDEDICCEDFGVNITYPRDENNVIISHEDIIGSTVISTEIGEKIYGLNETGPCRRIISIDFKVITDRGVFTYQFYNDHNGYYEHDVTFIIGDYVLITEI